MSYTIRDLINNNKDENIAITSENNNVINVKANNNFLLIFLSLRNAVDSAMS